MDDALIHRCKVMSANQSKVKTRLADWLQIKLNQDDEKQYEDVRDKALISELEAKRKAFLNKIISYLRTEGHCFGFSIARGAMVAIGYKKWWDEIVDILEKTDVSKADFNKKIALNTAVNETTLEEIFSKVLNFIVPSQVSEDESVADFSEKGVSQLEFIAPNKNHLQILGKLPELKPSPTDKDVLLTVKNSKLAGGYLSLKNAEDLFNMTDTEGLVCLVCNINHALQFDIEKKDSDTQYNLYDPNYELKTIYSYDTKEWFLDNIIHRLGNEIVFYILSLNKELPKDLFSSYDKFLKEKPTELARGLGLFVTLSDIKDRFDSLVNNICSSSDKNGPEIIAKAFTEGDGIHNTLILIAEKNPASLSKLFDYAKNAPDFPNLVGKALDFQSESFSSSLAFMASRCTTELPKIIAEAEKDSTCWPGHLLSGLKSKDQNGITGLAKIICEGTDASFIVKTAAKYEETSRFVADSLLEKLNDNYLMFHGIVFRGKFGSCFNDTVTTV